MIENSNSSLAHIQSFPKIDLHRHLLGSVRRDTVWELCRRYNVELQYRSVKEFSDAITQQISSGGLTHYIQPWKLLREIIRHPEDIRRIAREAAIDARLDGVLYVEFRNSLPGLLITDGQSPQTQIPTDEYLDAIHDGFAEVSNISCRLIASVPRHAVGDSVPGVIERYADGFFSAIAKFRDPLIVGVDLTGVEKGWPAMLFKDIFAEARRRKLPVTIHAGETEGPEEVWAAIDELGASRIGHGTSAPSDPVLVEELIKRNIVLEVCPTSGWLMGAVKSRNMHPVIDCPRPIPYVICTDNPRLNVTTLSRELSFASQIANVQSEYYVESQFQLASHAAFAPEALMSLIAPIDFSESTPLVTMLASEAVFSRDWDSPEEDEAWAHL
jgi:adenosine deaminase